jgi:hypothetical protein
MSTWRSRIPHRRRLKKLLKQSLDRVDSFFVGIQMNANVE